MFHADEIDEVMMDQVAMTERCPSVASYFENMGVCFDCVSAVGLAWAVRSMPTLTANLPQDGTPEELAQAVYNLVTEAAQTGFVRGYTTGLIMGRGDL